MTAPVQNWGQALDWGAGQLSARECGKDSCEAPRDAGLLLAHLLGCDRAVVLAFPERPFSAEQFADFRAMIARRCADEPVARIIGVREFWSLPFQISPHTLDPRPESETLVEVVNDWLCAQPAQGPFRLLDLGTGSGCLLLSLLYDNVGAVGVGTDRSMQALSQARCNARCLGVATRARFVVGSWCDAVAGGWDVILSNPPYIAPSEHLAPAVLDYDPHTALFAAEGGLACYRLLIPQAFDRLKNGGLLAVEIGKDQHTAVQKIMTEAGFTLLPPAPDLGGILRVCRAVRP